MLAYATDALEDLELDTVDARFSIRGEDPPPDDLVVVEIDDVTFDELEMRWPFPRRLHGKVIDAIVADKPKAIGYDVQFSEPSDDFDSDLALAEAIGRAKGRIVLATTETNRKRRGQVPRRPGGGAPGGVRRAVRQRPLPERPGRRDPADVARDRRDGDARCRDGRGGNGPPGRPRPGG